MRDLATYCWIKCLLVGANAFGWVSQKTVDASKALAIRAHDLTQEEAERLGMTPKAPEDDERTHH